jgi:hypothetical protein
MKSRLETPLLAAGRKAGPPGAGNQRHPLRTCQVQKQAGVRYDHEHESSSRCLYCVPSGLSLRLAPRYRRAILTGNLAARLEELLREVCNEREWIVEALTIQPDHVHLFVSCPPRDAPATVVNVIKSIIDRELFAAYRTQLRRTHWGGKLGADG